MAISTAVKDWRVPLFKYWGKRLLSLEKVVFIILPFLSWMRIHVKEKSLDENKDLEGVGTVRVEIYLSRDHPCRKITSQE